MSRAEGLAVRMINISYVLELPPRQNDNLDKKLILRESQLITDMKMEYLWFTVKI
jgi:hypothetical protein